MATDGNNPNNQNEAGTQQTGQTQTPVNPFRDAEADAPQPSVEEETELEQQRKEAMTERD